MIFTDRTITVRKGESRIDEPIVVYRGDYELEVRFTILNSRFKFMSGTNMIESEKASYGQLAILTPYGGNIFSDVVRCNDGSVTFVLTAEMLNQIEEVGLYSFQIRLMDYNKESRVSIPPIEFGIEVREPIASEDHDNSVNNAIVGYSIAKVVDPKEENVGDTFDESGNYNKTEWKTGDRISEGKLNKIEDAIDHINKNEVNNTATLSKRIDNNFNVLDSTKTDKTYTDSLQNQLNNLVLGAVGDGNNAEVIQARGTFDVLNDRLEHSEEKVNNIVKEVWRECRSSVLNGFINTDGSVNSDCYHMEVSVTPGEKYNIKTNSGFQLKPYVFLDSNNNVVDYYNEYENSTFWHEYDLYVVIPYNASKIIVNSYDKSFIGLKRYECLKVDQDAIDKLPNNIVHKENLSTDLSSLFIEKYDPLTFSVETGFMTIDGVINGNAGYYTSLDVFSGEKYIIKTNSGLQLKPYVFLDSNNNVVGYYNEYENVTSWHEYDLYVVIPYNASKIIINSYDKSFIGLKRYECLKVDQDAIDKLPNNIVHKENLSTDLSSLFIEKYDPLTFSVKTGFMTIDGVINGNAGYYTSLDVFSGEKYIIKTNSGFQLKPYVFLDSNNNVVDYYNEYENSTFWHEYDLYVVIPYNASKIIINSYDKSFIGLKRYECLKVDQDAIDKLPNNIVHKENLSNNIVHKENLSTDLSSLFIEKYDPLTFSVKTGFMTIDGVINGNAGYYTSLDVFSGERYKIETNYGFQMHAYVLIDTQGSVVEYAINDSTSSTAVKTFDVEVDVDGVLYVNTYASLYTKIQKFIGYTIKNSDNVLFEKKVVFFGDSITHGSGSWADKTTIRSKNKMTGDNFGVSGSQYTVRDDSDNSNNIYLRIVSKYDEISDADYIIISGMVNDALRGMPIGTMTDYSDFECECDVSTVYGAYEKTIRYILENHGGVKLGVIITPNIPSSSSLNGYFDVVRNICKKYSVPVLDLYYNSGLCAGISTVRDSFYKGDNIHPNELGYEKYLNDKVEAFMKSL